MSKDTIKTFEQLSKTAMQREINEYLMGEGNTPFTALDRANKDDIVSFVRDWNIRTKTKLKGVS
jgi:hypothetical protein